MDARTTHVAGLELVLYPLGNGRLAVDLAYIGSDASERIGVASATLRTWQWHGARPRPKTLRDAAERALRQRRAACEPPTGPRFCAVCGLGLTAAQTTAHCPRCRDAAVTP